MGLTVTDLTGSTGGRYTIEEIQRANNGGINYLEILPAGLGLKAL